MFKCRKSLSRRLTRVIAALEQALQEKEKI